MMPPAVRTALPVLTIVTALAWQAAPLRGQAPVPGATATPAAVGGVALGFNYWVHTRTQASRVVVSGVEEGARRGTESPKTLQQPTHTITPKPKLEQILASDVRNAVLSALTSPQAHPPPPFLRPQGR